jgi:hypothetical protein
VREEDAVRVQVTRQVAHWRTATAGLADLETFASGPAWASLERYLDTGIRASLTAAVARLAREADGLAVRLAAAQTSAQLEALRRDAVAFRRRFLTVEQVLEFYGDAVNTRTTPRLAALLRACDELAELALETVLLPLGRPVPPVLTFVHNGLGASVMRAGQHLWDGATLNPAAVIKMTHYGLARPTALIHEAGHQLSAELGWAEEMAGVLQRRLAAHSPELGAMWASWSSEIVADVFAFVHAGYGAVAGLHDVVAGEPAAVFRLAPGDPHPVAYLRVLLGTELCVHSFGMGPWDDLAEAWRLAHPLLEAPARSRALLRMSLGLMPEIAALCLRTPLQGFGGRAVVELVDPRRVAPGELRALEQRIGGEAGLRSAHWLRTEALRLLALSSYRAATEPDLGRAAGCEEWMTRLGGPAAVAA